MRPTEPAPRTPTDRHSDADAREQPSDDKKPPDDAAASPVDGGYGEGADRVSRDPDSARRGAPPGVGKRPFETP